MVEIVKVETRRQLMQFIKFPFSLYQGCPNWVPPLVPDEMFTLDSRKNPAFEFSESAYWLAKRDGKVVGRIAGIISHAYIKKWGNKYCRFGWIDFIDDREVSKALLDTVMAWGKANGLDGAHGPLGFCDLDKEGMLVEGFDQMGTFISIYNYPYYREHLEALGFVKDAEWVEWDIGYEGLYATIPVTEKQVASYVKKFFGFLNIDYISVIMDREGKIAGFGIVMPSLRRAAQKSKGRLFPFGFIHWLRAIKHNNMLDLYLVAVRPELKMTGVPFIMLSEMTQAAMRNGITHAIASPELETNTAVHSMWRNYDAKIHRRRRAYLKTW